MKKIFSLILSLAMLLTITSGLNLTAYADSSQYGNIFMKKSYKSTKAKKAAKVRVSFKKVKVK